MSILKGYHSVICIILYLNILLISYRHFFEKTELLKFIRKYDVNKRVGRLKKQSFDVRDVLLVGF